MKRLILFLAIVILASCIKIPENRYNSIMKVPYDFDWKTIESKPVSLNTVSTVINEMGDTVASSLPPGSYNLIVGKESKLTVVQESTPQSVQTKTIVKGNIKEVVYFPAKNRYATVMMEDLFPYRGDMDMNDIVFGLNLEFYLDNQARVRSFSIKIQPRAIGSSYREIGIGASLYSSSNISFVDKITHSSSPALSGFFPGVVVNAQGQYGVEPGNRFDVIPVTGDFRSYFSGASELFVNVREVDPFFPTQEFEVYVELKSNTIFSISLLSLLSPLQAGRVNLDIFGLFGHRGREVHFKGGVPTNYFYLPFFIAAGRGDFSTPDNWVWAVMSDQSIRHPQEFKRIYNAYPNFKVWAESGGAAGGGWYSPAIADSLYSKGSF